jgi:hypothetical protein
MRTTTTKSRPRIRVARDSEETVLMPTVEDCVAFVRGALLNLPEGEAEEFLSALRGIVQEVDSAMPRNAQEEPGDMAARGIPGSRERVARDARPRGVAAFDEMFPEVARIKSNPGPVRRKQPAPPALPAGIPSFAERFPTIARIKSGS